MDDTCHYSIGYSSNGVLQAVYLNGHRLTEDEVHLQGNTLIVSVEAVERYSFKPSLWQRIHRRVRMIVDRVKGYFLGEPNE